MKNIAQLALLSALTVVTFSCKDDDEDPASPKTMVAFTAENIATNEAAQTAIIGVTIANANTTPTTVKVVLKDGSAADLSGYTTQTVTFAANSAATQNITINISQDSDLEPNETFTFELQEVTGGNNASTGTPKTLTLSVADGSNPPTSTVTTLQGNIGTNTTLLAGQTYLMKGFVYVTSGATLTIQPGTVIKGDKDTKATLIVERGGKIMADGTASEPIVFTSNQAKGSRAAGDWGGIIILGKAPVNAPGSPFIEGGVDRAYGGADASDNSGILRYVRIEYPGIAFQPGNEINGLTLGGVGSGTVLDHVQVSHCGDDAFEWFGGTVNAKHLIAYKTVDDMFDTDLGYNGMVQYAVGLSDPNVADASKSNGFESDNDASGSANTPLTAPKFVNISLFGPKATSATTASSDFGRGMHIRRNSHLEMHNGVVAGWPTGLLLDGSGSQGGAKVHHTVLAGAGTNLAVQSGSTMTVTDLENWYNQIMPGNMLLVNNSELAIANPFNMSAPNFMPTAGSPLLSGGVSVAGAESNTFRGAFGATDWTGGWANWDPQNTDY